MPAAADLHDTAAARLRSVGQRYTTGRRSLVDALVDSPGPVTIPQILGARPEMAQSSAYRNLAVLEQAAVVHRIVTSDDFSRYELAEDLTEHHHHVICSSCGEVADFTLDARTERNLDKVLGSAADRLGYQLEHHRLDLVGLCPTCH